MTVLVDRALLNGISALIKKDLRELPCPFQSLGLQVQDQGASTAASCRESSRWFPVGALYCAASEDSGYRAGFATTSLAVACTGYSNALSLSFCGYKIRRMGYIRPPLRSLLTFRTKSLYTQQLSVLPYLKASSCVVHTSLLYGRGHLTLTSP